MKFNPKSIVRLREAMGLNQAQMAVKIGVSRAIVGYWENGTATPNARQLARIMEATGAQPGVFFEPEPACVHAELSR